MDQTFSQSSLAQPRARFDSSLAPPRARFDQVAGDTRTKPGTVFFISLLLLGMSYVLLLAAPLVSARLSGVARGLHWPSLERWIPAASGAGLALGGGAALLFVLARLSKDVRQHPYASVAPALAAFSTCVLIGLGAKLPLGATEPLCVFALALSVMGGSLVQGARLGGQIMGWSLTLAPTASLVAAVWAASEHEQLSRAIWALSPTSRLFLAMLALSSVSMALLGMVARNVGVSSLPHSVPVSRQVNSFAEREDTLELALRSAEIELTKRPMARPVLVALACVLAGIGVAVWQRTSTPSVPSVALNVEAVGSTLEPKAVVTERTDIDLAPRVEPYVPNVVPPSSALVELEPAREPEPPLEVALAVQAPIEPAQQDETSVPVVVTSRASHTTKTRTLRAKQVEARTRVREPRKVQAKRAVVRKEAPPVVASVSAGPKPSVEPDRTESARPVVAAAPAVAAPGKSRAAAPTRGDESLDELMDRVVDPKPSKASAIVADDPIFGL